MTFTICSRAVIPQWSRFHMRKLDSEKIYSAHSHERFFRIFDRKCTHQIVVYYKEPTFTFNGFNHQINQYKRLVWRYEDKNDCKKDFIKILSHCSVVETAVY